VKALKVSMGVVVLVLLVVAYAAPIGPLPGFVIGGQSTPVPDAWEDTSAIDEIRLAVGDGLPRVVIIWMVQVEGIMHVVGAADGGWTTRIGQTSPVRMRLGDATYDLQASRVNEGLEPILEAYVAKYREDYPDIVAGFPSFEEAGDSFAVFRLDAR